MALKSPENSLRWAPRPLLLPSTVVKLLLLCLIGQGGEEGDDGDDQMKRRERPGDGGTDRDMKDKKGRWKCERKKKNEIEKKNRTGKGKSKIGSYCKYNSWLEKIAL